MTSTRPKRNVRNTIQAAPVEDDATIVRNTLDRLVYTVDVMARFDQTRRDIAAVHRGETTKTMAQVMTEARWHEHATKAKKDCPLGSTRKKRYYTIEEESDSEEEEDDPNVPSTSAKKTPKPTPEKKVPTPSKAKLAAMKKKEQAAKRKADREAKKLEALNEKDEDEEKEEESFVGMPVLESVGDLPTTSYTPNCATPELVPPKFSPIIPEITVEEYKEKEPEQGDVPERDAEPAVEEMMEVDEPMEQEPTVQVPETQLPEVSIPEPEQMEVDDPVAPEESIQEPAPIDFAAQQETSKADDKQSIAQEVADQSTTQEAPEKALEETHEAPKNVPVEPEATNPPPEELLANSPPPENVNQDEPAQDQSEIAPDQISGPPAPEPLELPPQEPSPVETAASENSVEPTPETSSVPVQLDIPTTPAEAVQEVLDVPEDDSLAQEEPETQPAESGSKPTEDIKPTAFEDLDIQLPEAPRRPWTRPGTTVDIIDYKNPEDANYSPEERDMKPWLGNDVPLYPLDLLPPIDNTPGRVWYPERRFCETTMQEMPAIGPINELETLELSFIPETIYLMDSEKYDLIVKRMLEIEMDTLKKKIQQPRLQTSTRVEINTKLHALEAQYKDLTEKSARLRLQILCLPEYQQIIPDRSFLVKYAFFDHTWWTSNRKWFDKSLRKIGHVTQQDFLDQFEATEDPTILEFQREMLANAKQLEEEAAEEKIRNFQLPLVSDLTNHPSHARDRMMIFREKIARYFQYEDFERCYMTDPALRELYKKLRPIPFYNGVILQEAHEELFALISQYKKRFAVENPVNLLPKAGNEKLPIERDIVKIVERCAQDLVDTVVLRELTDLSTFPHRVPAHNNSVQRLSQTDL
ncbi:Protein CBG01880 [Caenorhabditis briggsae]|uniref:Protein CBG01880 n=2 Tax=Caenorhabditis briggsae TaxID=6238 RepID=A8WRH4_CAEBR|nr:Protein CBG01880 [Caenorhabditis briggsae]CAP23082.1 Protein CBG01880 [Caenorhabditis briggsae]